MLFFFAALSLAKNATCYIEREGDSVSLKMVEDVVDKDGGCAWATWDNGLEGAGTTGWYQLHVEGTSNRSICSDAEMVRCAGAVEGYLSQESIWNGFVLILDSKNWPREEPHYPDGWSDYMETAMRFVRESFTSYPEVPYWQAIELIYRQFEGISEGYDMALQAHGVVGQNMTLLDHWMLQSQGDLGDAEHAVGRYAKGPVGPTKRLIDVESGDPVTLGDHCTGLFKLTKDYSDVYMAHDAWSTYLDLHGALKEYKLPTEKFVAQRLLMSTRVGKLSSYDDFYIADSGLFVIETTMSLFNEDLYEFVKPQTLFTWMRAVHAMWTAHNGSEWTQTFIKHNSGTYNNQYLVLDSNKFERFKKPTTDLLWVIEQYPGPHWKRADVTEQLVRDMYFPSINKPSFKELYTIAGYPEKVAASGATGNFYTYETSARYLLIQREAPRLDDFELFKSFMRYNNWRRDIYSNGDASQQIMSRYDQRRKDDPYGAAKMFGGLDSKCMRLTEAVTSLQFHAIASPSHDDNPIWNFSGSAWPEVKHDGLPDVWNFSWINFKSADFTMCGNYGSKAECIENPWCGWCTFDQRCLAGDKSGPFSDEQCESGWSVKTNMPTWSIPVIVAVCVVVGVVIIVTLVLHFTKKRRTAQGASFETLIST